MFQAAHDEQHRIVEYLEGVQAQLTELKHLQEVSGGTGAAKWGSVGAGVSGGERRAFESRNPRKGTKGSKGLDVFHILSHYSCFKLP